MNEYSYLRPSVAYVNKKLYIAWTDTDNRINIMSFHDGFLLQKKVKLNETSYLAPSIAASDSELLLAWIDTDSRLNTLKSINGTTWSNKVTYSEKSNYSPTVSYTGNYKDFYIAWTGTNSAHNLNIMSDGGSINYGFDRKRILNITSYEPPSITTSLGFIFCAWSDSGNYIKYSYFLKE